jgi:hypothetical protein
MDIWSVCLRPGRKTAFEEELAVFDTRTGYSWITKVYAVLPL